MKSKSIWLLVNKVNYSKMQKTTVKILKVERNEVDQACVKF